MLDAARETLKNVFGYQEFRPFQEGVISRVLEGRDTLAVMPTGGGKSLCYQIPALVFSGITVVVSPLIALMKDQVSFLRESGVEAVFLNSSLGREDYAQAMAAVRQGRAKLVYVAPESLVGNRVSELLAGCQLSCLAIDEAHCISEWGHDFRPEYRMLAQVRRAFPRAVCLALTATATPQVRSDIRENLSIGPDGEVLASFDRPNLFLEVRAKHKPFDQLLEFLQPRREESGIIYCFSRARADEVAAKLAAKGFSALAYHAGLDDKTRSRNQERFIRDDVQIMAATIAFGMGIDKPNVRFVVHYDLPKSLENYYQEIGRAGRDGLPARGLLLYAYSDAVKLTSFLERDAAESGSQNPAARANLKAVVDFAESSGCRRKRVLAHFGENYAQDDCQGCDACQGKRDGSTTAALVDITIPALKFLSCVKRSGERFGAGHVIDILRGSKSEKIERLGHDALSTYGIGKDWDESQWFDLSRQLERLGYVERLEAGGGLGLTDLAYQTFKSRAPILGRPPQPKPARARKGAKKPAPISSLSPEDEALRLALRHFRKTLADSANVPPYVIFSDRTLEELVQRKPQNATELLEIFGMGKVKVERYGNMIYALIRELGQGPN